MRNATLAARGDDPGGVESHINRYQGGKALVVLGGYSASDWQELYAEIKPDVLLGANGVNSIIHDLDYWMMMENLTRMNRRAKEGEADGKAFVEMLHRDTGKAVRLIAWHSWRILKDIRNCIRVRRQPYELHELPKDFSFRDYGMGYLAGGISVHTEGWKKDVRVNVGTVGLQLLHHAGILGVSEIHTIGFDLMFRDDQKHHAYQYPRYVEDKYRTLAQFVDYEGVKTQWLWIETAKYLKAIEPIFSRDGIRWVDHSNGLLKLEGLECAA